MDNENKCKVNRKKRNGDRGRAEIFANQMSELKQFLHNEINRGVNAAEVERKLDDKIDKIVTEVRDYERLEHLIDAKAKDAVGRVDARIGIIAVAVAALAFFGWDIFVDNVTKSAVSRIGESAAKTEINRVVSNQVYKARNEIKTMVSSEIDVRVPRLIEKHIESVNIIAKAATENIQNVQSKVEVMAIVTAARANSRKHFDLLVDLSSDTNRVVEAQIAKDAIKAIQGTYKQRKYSFDYYKPVLKMNDGRKLGPDLLMQLVHADYDWNCDGAIGELANLNRKEFVATLIHAVQHSKRIDTVYLAINSIEKLTGKTFQPLGINEVLEWWKDADKDKQYHSEYEWYCDMKDKMIVDNREDLEKTLTKLIAESQRKKEREPNFKIASKLIVHLIMLFPDFETMMNDGRQELYKNSLKDLEGTQYQDSSWYVNKAYFLCITDTDKFYKFVNERLIDHPDFEGDLKRSSLFKEELFEREQIKWPSKLPPEKRKPNQKPDVLTIPLNRAQFVIHNPPPQINAPAPRKREIQSQNVVGFSTAQIKKGRRELTEFPTNGTETTAMQKLGDLKTGVCKGDSISWKTNEELLRFSFDGSNWIDANTNKVEDVIIPAGVTRITYERTKDKETSVTFTVASELPL